MTMVALIRSNDSFAQLNLFHWPVIRMIGIEITRYRQSLDLLNQISYRQ